MRLIQVVAVAAALSTAGCWTDACVEPQAPTDLPVCHERFVSVLLEIATDSESDEPSAFCESGTFYGVQSCRDLGYTRECAPYVWVEPGIDCAVTGGTGP